MSAYDPNGPDGCAQSFPRLHRDHAVASFATGLEELVLGLQCLHAGALKDAAYWLGQVPCSFADACDWMQS